MARFSFSPRRLFDAKAELVVSTSDPANRIAPPPGEAGFSGLFFAGPLQEVKTAIVPPLTFCPVVFIAPQLVKLTFAITDEPSRCAADRDCSPLMSYHGYDVNYYPMLQNLNHFEVVCSAADDIEVFMQWLRNMPRLDSPPVNIVHQHHKSTLNIFDDRATLKRSSTRRSIISSWKRRGTSR